MNWNELRNDWQGRPGDLPPTSDLRRPDGQERLWRRVRFRDAIETAVALVLLPLFGLAALGMAKAGEWIAALFAVALVLAIAYIPYRLWQARRSIPEPDPSEPVSSFLVAERAALVAQAEMLRTVARWYSGPICIGVVGFFISVAGFGIDALLYALVVGGVFISIEVGNRAAVRKRFEPAIAAVEAQIESINTKYEESNESY